MPCLTLQDVLIHEVDVVDVEGVIVYAEVLGELHVSVDVHEARVGRGGGSGVTGLQEEQIVSFMMMVVTNIMNSEDTQRSLFMGLRRPENEAAWRTVAHEQDQHSSSV